MDMLVQSHHKHFPVDRMIAYGTSTDSAKSNTRSRLEMLLWLFLYVLVKIALLYYANCESELMIVML
jgi:hypothetical protein